MGSIIPKKYVLILLVAALILGSLPTATSDEGFSGSFVRAYESHGVIVVNNDSDLDSLAASEGWQGDGSAANPYVIENYEIDATGNTVGIYFGNTTKHVVIRNTYIHGAHYSYGAPLYYRDGSAIKLYNAQNVSVVNCSLGGNDYGVYVDMSLSITIRKNYFSGNVKQSITAVHSSYVAIEGNEMTGSGIMVGGLLTEIETFSIPSNNTVNGKPVYFYNQGNMNNLTVPEDAGQVIANGVSYLRINNIEILNSNFAIQILYSHHIHITNVTIGHMSQVGIYVYGSDNVTISHSKIYEVNSEGIRLLWANNNVIENTEIYGMSRPYFTYAVKVYGDHNVFRNNYIHDTSASYGYGIVIGSGNGNLITENLIMNKYNGIRVGESRDDVYNTRVTYNTVCNSSHYGISVWKGSGHEIFGNILCYNHDSTTTYDPSNIQAWDSVGAVWNTTQGNFWLDWAANNWSNDNNHDGYVDWNYSIYGSAGSVDAKPLKYSPPAIPNNFEAKAGDGFVNLTWDEPLTWGLSSPQEYRVYRDGTLIATLDPSTTYYNDTSVQNGQYYLYYVVAVNSKGWASKPTIERYAIPWGTNYVEHDAIRINSDAELIEFVTSENLKGNGTAWDPYIISGYAIDGEGKGAGIYIGNTTLNFVIRDCYFYNATMSGYIRYFSGSGVHLYYVKNFSLYGNVFENNRYGIHVYYSENAQGVTRVIEGNIIRGGIYSIWLYSSWYVSIINNTMVGSGIYIDGGFTYFPFSSTYTIEDNTVNGAPIYYYKNGAMGNAHVPTDAGQVIVSSVSYLVIDGLHISGSNPSVQVFESNNIQIVNSRFDGGSIFVGHTTFSRIYNNILNGGYIQLAYGDSNVVSNNTLYDASGSGAIYIALSDYNIVTSNAIHGAYGRGILIWTASYNQIGGNLVEHCQNNGIEIGGGVSERNLIVENDVLNNYGSGFIPHYGIYLGEDARNTTVYGNHLYYNHHSGDTYDAGRIQAFDDGYMNRWNTTSEGNYWHDWANNNDSNDNDHNGTVDWPYKIAGSAGSKDYRPLKYSVPTPPQNIRALSGQGFANISWDPPVGDGGRPITGYRIYRNGTLIDSVPASQLYYNDTSVANGVNYTYYVTAVNSRGEGMRSDEITVMPGAVPEPPQNLIAIAGDGYVNITWSAPVSDGGVPVREYRIYRNGTLIATVPAGQLWYNDTNVVNGVTYTYYVTAVNAVGESPKSNEVQATPGAVIPELSPVFVFFLSLIFLLAMRRKL